MSKDNHEEVETITINIQPFIMPITVLLSVLIFSGSFLFGMDMLADGVREGGTGTKSSVLAQEEDDSDTYVAEPTDAADDGANLEAVSSIDDDPYIGNKDDAKIAIIEFTDLECPFCKRHHEETFPQIIENYVDTGDAIYVLRDYALSFHEPVASQEAVAAECVDDLGDNEKYFKFLDLVFANTGTNGVGVTGGADTLADYADQVGVNKGDFETCLKEMRFQEEIDADQADGTASGVQGTPGFIIGVLNDDGTVDGVNVSGAQPFSAFEAAIQEQLDRV